LVVNTPKVSAEDFIAFLVATPVSATAVKAQVINQFTYMLFYPPKPFGFCDV
jgi:hypothetical protein